MVSLQYGLVFFSFISISYKGFIPMEKITLNIVMQYTDFFSAKYSEVSIYVIYIYVEPLWKV